MGSTSTSVILTGKEHDKLTDGAKVTAQEKAEKAAQGKLPLPSEKKRMKTTGPNLPLGDRRRKKKKGTAGQTPAKGKQAA
jgi:hypothetical protein